MTAAVNHYENQRQPEHVESQRIIPYLKTTYKGFGDAAPASVVDTTVCTFRRLALALDLALGSQPLWTSIKTCRVGAQLS